MGQLYTTGENNIDGPWLIGKEDLADLDEILKSVEVKLSESLEKEIHHIALEGVEQGDYATLDEALEKKRKYHYRSNQKSNATLISKNGKFLEDNTIFGLLKDPKLTDFHPKELKVIIEKGLKNRFSLTVSTVYDGELKYSIQCFDHDIQEEIHYAITNWIEKHRPNKIKQFWSQNYFIIGGLFGFITLITFIVMVQEPTVDLKKLYGKEIQEILKQGVNKDNHDKAIEILLRYTTGYIPENFLPVKKISSLVIQIFSISTFLTLVSILRPKTTIGIGTTKQIMKFYKFYVNLVLITIPLTFIIPPLIDWIKALAKI
ncbi:MAG: hypothetical protein K0Q95_2094 [Bacteroidota bacterium]|jgi:hypothetical protein|nr:hypothetical protein [Bacteroidota bacterium]